MLIERLGTWHKTKPGILCFVVIELAITYGFASLAIDRGHIWWYLLTLIFLYGSLHNLFRLFRSFRHA